MESKLLLLLVLLIGVAQSASASPEDQFHEGNSVGKSGWDMYYGPDPDLDEQTEEERRQIQEREADRERRKREEAIRGNDFFSTGVGTVDKSLSRTDRQEKIQRGNQDDLE